jgi:hypothetical protein
MVGASMVLAVLAVLYLGVAPASAARGHVFTGSFGAPGSGPGQLGEPAGIAVNETTGAIYYLDKTNNRVEIFNLTGTKFEGEFNGSGLGLGIMGSGQLLNEGKAAGSGGLPEEVPTGRFDEPDGIAVDNDPSSPSFGDVYVADQHGHEETFASHPVVDKFSASGEYIGQITRNPDGEPFSEDGFRNLYGVAVDSHGELWVEERNFGGIGLQYAVNYTNAVANVWLGFRSNNGGASFFRSGDPTRTFAVDSEDNFYVNLSGIRSHEGEDLLIKDNVRGELVVAEVDEEEPTGVAVELSSNDVYISHLTNVHRVDPTGKSLESLTIPAGGHGSSVTVDAATSTVYVVDSAAGKVDMFGPEPPGVPTVTSGSESVGDVTATSASFSAEVNPRSEPFEEATSYSFEYGPCDTPTTCKSSPYVDSVPVPAGILAANYEPDFVSVHPQDLVAHTMYHVRLVAHNSYPGVVEGEELTFTTQATGVFSLSDGRVWEMVSPPNKYGAGIEAGFNVTQASVNGDAITYHANAPIEAQPPGNYDSIVQALAAHTASGWQSRNINTLHETAPGAGENEYPFFSADLSFGLLQPAGAFVASLSAEASEQTPFLRSDFVTGDPGQVCTGSCYTPLVTGAPGFENVPSGTVFGEEVSFGRECTAGECGPKFVGASPDASHVLLQYPWAPLVKGAPLGSLYEWTAGVLSVVSILPNEHFAPGATLGSSLGTGTNFSVRNAVSLDGSGVVWSYGSHLYLRDSAKAETVQLDEVQGGSGAGASEPIFQTASGNDTRIFFTDGQQLTNDAVGRSDLYECEIVEEAGQLKCQLTDLTGGANTMGLIPGVSEDGSYVYFVANGVLPGVPANERGETAMAGRPNFYVRRAGATKLIAVLSSDDSPDWAGGYGTLNYLTARVSGNGRWLSFMSDRPLTGFDNRDATSGKRDEEVFLYHAGESGEGKLVCGSCNPTGSRPHGVVVSNSGSFEGVFLGPVRSLIGTGNGVAGILPDWTTAFYQSRYLSDGGRLFFDSYDALVPQDTNGAEDAYQFEPSGVGSCTEASITFVVASGGCVGLISSGTSKEPSAFLDASESGGDVFFLTFAQLSPLDIDTAIDIYDAHECSTGESCSPPVSPPVPACEGDACQSPVASPEDPTPGSLTYQGPGNLLPSAASAGKLKPKGKPVRCKGRSVKRHGKCVKTKARKHAKKAKRSSRRGK